MILVREERHCSLAIVLVSNARSNPKVQAMNSLTHLRSLFHTVLARRDLIWEGTDWEEAVDALLIEFAVESNAICVVQRRLKFA